MTRQVCGRIFLSASVAFSARYSWKKLKTPLMILTAQTAMPNCGICAKKAPMPATHSIIAMRCVKLATNLTIKGVPLASLRRFGPKTAKRCWASSWVNPSGRECKPAYSSSEVFSWILARKSGLIGKFNEFIDILLYVDWVDFMKFNGGNHTTNKLRVNDCKARALYF